MNVNSVLEVQNQQGYSVIRFFGYVDAATVEQVKPVITAKIPPDCAHLIIDLEKVEFLDSHGVGLFVSQLKKVHNNHGKMVFSGATGQPASVLNIVGFNHALVSYCDDMPHAVALMKAAEG
jgi:anti-sigma B factor antagonist